MFHNMSLAGSDGSVEGMVGQSRMKGWPGESLDVGWDQTKQLPTVTL